MKTIAYRILAAIVVALTLSACHTVIHESAMEWMERQPMGINDP